VIDFTSDPGWIRTSDPQLRRLLLYPAVTGIFLIQVFEIQPYFRSHLFQKATEKLDLTSYLATFFSVLFR
jgi:hypothetical protein